jgi:DNA-binding transcriptional LysR family regulator
MLHPFVRRILRAFRDAYPEIELALDEGNAAELTRAVEAGRMAAGFLRIPVARPPGIMFLELLQEPLLVVLPAAHKLACGTMPLDLRALAEERFILVRQPGAPGIYENVIQACRAAGFAPKVVAEVPHMLTNVNLVAAGAGVSIVPASMQEIGFQDVRYRTLRPEHALAAPLTLVCLTGNDDPILVNLVALAQGLAASEGSPSHFSP